MQFTSRKFSHIDFVVEPKDTIITPGKPVTKIVGLMARFRKFNFDSVETQRSMRWTDDQRMLVEATLLRDNSFGRRNSNTMSSIWLVPSGAAVDVNVDIPDELEAFNPGLRAEVAAKLGLEGNIVPLSPNEGNCEQMLSSEGALRQCRRKAEDGSFCKQHAKMQDPNASADEVKDIIEEELVSA